MAGYIAAEERWERFSDRWQSILDLPPRIDGAFKMKDFYRRGGLTPKKSARLIMLYDAIQEFASAEIAIAFDPNKMRAAFEPVARELGKENQNPHLFAYGRLMVAVAGGQSQLGLEGPIKFIFDEQMHEKRHLIEAWEWSWKIAKPHIPNLRDIIGSTPEFETDERMRPLQAADMLAWWLRKRFVSQARGKDPIVPPWSERPHKLAGWIVQYNGDELKAQAEAVLARNKVFRETGR